jgi:hypothetical protein
MQEGIRSLGYKGARATVYKPFTVLEKRTPAVIAGLPRELEEPPRSLRLREPTTLKHMLSPPPTIDRPHREHPRPLGPTWRLSWQKRRAGKNCGKRPGPAREDPRSCCVSGTSDRGCPMRLEQSAFRYTLEWTGATVSMPFATRVGDKQSQRTPALVTGEIGDSPRAPYGYANPPPCQWRLPFSW